MAVWWRTVRGFDPHPGTAIGLADSSGEYKFLVGDRVAGRAQGREYFREM